MAESNGVSSHGVVVKHNGVAIAELKDVTPPPRTRKTFEKTTHNENDDSYVVGIRRRGDLTLTVNWLGSGEATHTSLLTSYAAGTKDLWEIDFPDGGTWAFSGFVTNIAPKDPVEGVQDAAIGIRPTGAHVITP